VAGIWTRAGICANYGNMTGKAVSHCTISEKLHGGRTGEVYRVQDMKPDRLPALKFLPKRLLCDKEAKRRFSNEAEATSVLDHANIVALLRIDEAESECSIYMERLEGKPIKQISFATDTFRTDTRCP
jgi:serine/threonine protein kinase